MRANVGFWDDRTFELPSRISCFVPRLRVRFRQHATRAGCSDQLPRTSAPDRSCRWNAPNKTVGKAPWRRKFARPIQRPASRRSFRWRDLGGSAGYLNNSIHSERLGRP